MSSTEKLVAIFLGPTMRVADARRHIDALFLPPACGGDVYACVKTHDPAVIGIVDGCFDQAPSVRHKEVLFALDHGVHVFGAASMGALRAAELAAFGMVGVGAIYEGYRDGTYEGDDEVAVEHADAEFDYRALSDALVNIRAGLADARRQGIIGSGTESALVSAARQRFYAERRWADLLTDARGFAPPEEVEALRLFIRETRPNQKKADAIELFGEISGLLRGPFSKFSPKFEFHATPFWERMRACVDQRLA
jgi:hypothetical protein